MPATAEHIKKVAVIMDGQQPQFHKLDQVRTREFASQDTTLNISHHFVVAFAGKLCHLSHLS